MKTRLWIILTGVLLIQPLSVLAENYSGQWLGTITESNNRCESLGKAEPGEYKLTIVHKDNEIMIMENVVQRPYKGVINPQRPQNIYVNGAYNEDGGYVTEMVDIVFTDEEKGEGQSVWSWSDGYHQCGGRFKFKLEKIRD